MRDELQRSWRKVSGPERAHPGEVMMAARRATARGERLYPHALPLLLAGGRTTASPDTQQDDPTREHFSKRSRMSHRRTVSADDVAREILARSRHRVRKRPRCLLQREFFLDASARGSHIRKSMLH